MKKILVPTDFSEHAENALQIAAQLAKNFKSEIYLLHMIELPATTTGPVGDMRSNDLPEAIGYMKLAKKRFSEILSRPYLKDLKVREIVEFHQAFEGIMETSKEHGCDFIVMGSKGASGFKEMFIGSNTEKVVRTSEIPVLVIKDSNPSFEVKNFIFATNLDNSNKATLEKVVSFSKLMNSRLHLLYINTANEFITSKDTEAYLEKYIEGVDLGDYEFHVYNDDSVEQGVLNFAKKVNADLIGIATHGRKGLSHFFNGSISEDLVNHANSPVITFKLEKPEHRKNFP